MCLHRSAQSPRSHVLCTTSGFAIAMMAAALAVTAAQAPPSEAHGQSVRADNYYAAGDRIEITAPMGGDVIVAGRQIDIVQPVSGDIPAAGWRVVLSAQADDDVRIAAAEVALNAPINHRGRARAGEGGERDSALR